MKTSFLLLLSLLFFVTTSQAQKDFEGKITFSMEYEGAMASQMAAMAPSSMIYQVKGVDTRFEMKGGMMASALGIVIAKSNEKMMYMIKDSEKKAYKMPMEKDAETTTKPTVTKEDEVVEILGYKCQKYKVVSLAQGQDITQYIWAAKDIKVSKPQGGGQAAGGNLHIEGVEGFPLKTIAIATVMGMEITTNTTAIEVSTKKLKKTDFTVPKGYKIEETTMKDYMGKMTGGL